MNPTSHESVYPSYGWLFMVDFLDMQFFATISELEFEQFKTCMAGMEEWPTYDDFIMDREGYLIGMNWAGLHVVQVEVGFRSFMRWLELTGCACTLEKLDDFAMRRWLRSKYPDWILRLVASKAKSPIADLSGQLCIPIYQTTVEVWRERVLPKISEGANPVLADVIAKECLDPAV